MTKFTDDFILAAIEVACRQNQLPVPAPNLTGAGIPRHRLKQLVKDGKLKRVPLYNKSNQRVWGYYPSTFTAYFEKAGEHGTDERNSTESASQDVSDMRKPDTGENKPVRGM